MRLVLGIALLFFGLSVPGVHCSNDDPIKFVRKDTDAMKNQTKEEKFAESTVKELIDSSKKVVKEVKEWFNKIVNAIEEGRVAHCVEEDKEKLEEEIRKHLDGMSPKKVVNSVASDYFSSRTSYYVFVRTVPDKTYLGSYLKKLCE
ncbi:hypothetical protein VCUG_02777, partial [Vavraia culicis subsp. floridensis]